VCLEYVLSQVFEIVQSCAALLPAALKNLESGGLWTIRLLRTRLHAQLRSLSGSPALGSFFRLSLSVVGRSGEVLRSGCSTYRRD